VPAAPLAALPGAPLGILGGLVLLAVIAAAIAIDRPVRHRLAWLIALTAIALVRWGSAALGPNLGWSAAYIASDDPGRSIERSTEFPRSAVTRVDRALDFDGAHFPVHFFNDIRRFNFYRPTDIARDTMPFRVSWNGILAERPPSATSVLLLTNGPATLQLGDEPPTTFPATELGHEYPLTIASFTSGTPIGVSYTRRFEVSPLMRLVWMDANGARWPVAAPEVAASRRTSGGRRSERRHGRSAH
jgi:hypothetical protein